MAIVVSFIFSLTLFLYTIVICTNFNIKLCTICKWKYTGICQTIVPLANSVDYIWSTELARTLNFHGGSCKNCRENGYF